MAFSARSRTPVTFGIALPQSYLRLEGNWEEVKMKLNVPGTGSESQAAPLQLLWGMGSSGGGEKLPTHHPLATSSSRCFIYKPAG